MRFDYIAVVHKNVFVLQEYAADISIEVSPLLFISSHSFGFVPFQSISIQSNPRAIIQNLLLPPNSLQAFVAQNGPVLLHKLFYLTYYAVQ